MSLGEGYQQKTASGRMTHDDLAAFPFRAVRIVMNPRKRVSEDGERLLERHSMLSTVRPGLRSIPRESGAHQIQAYHSAVQPWPSRLLDGSLLSCGARAQPPIRRGPPARRQLEPVVRHRPGRTTQAGCP